MGEVNALIKRLVKKGVLKIERINSRNIRYYLTPSGIKNITETSYNYIIASYRLIKAVEARVDLLFKEELLKEVVLLGRKDEIFVLLEDKLRHKGIGFHHVESFDMIAVGALVLVWQPEFVEEIGKDVGVEVVNLLREV